ncbi:hypothetical protein [Flavobacterium hercynium]|uniref:Uncharacterized protein n=1 Tax=Flavobacterium hercynium TaxID=387094 RepID=A0A226GPZ7_9FLAO|nr:hypothetical protein [Flavobacterium hercynium]OXA83430.1 hypothetical protein B0A66_22290 [Flavobacterium hercynium]SMP36914.1 hypothetical protein SAMN06265346_12529 [Flavobacterium hercynium]
MKILLIASLFIFSTVGCQEKKIKNLKNSLDIKNKSYRIYTRLSNCQAELFVDDMLAFSYMGDLALKGKRTAVEVPINTLLLSSGKHTIDLKIYPNLNQSTLNEDSYGEITLHYFDTDNYDKEVELFVKETPNGDHNNLNGLPYYQLKAEINLVLPFSIEGWTNSVDLKDEMENGNDLKREVQNSYDDIIKIIKDRDVNTFSKLIKEREDLLGVAFYSTSQQKKRQLK